MTSITMNGSIALRLEGCGIFFIAVLLSPDLPD
jgi:hypothetical protein